MAIATLDQYIAAAKQSVQYNKSTSATTVANNWCAVFSQNGSPGAGAIAGGSTAAGLVPVAGGTGYPIINFSTGTGYITNVDFGNTVACRMTLVDELFKAGAYTFSAGTSTLSSQPSYSGRVPGGTDYTNTQIWIQVSTAFTTGTAWQVQVTYTNQSGTTGRTSIISPAQGAAALTIYRMFQLPLQAGDTGVQKIESVIVTNGGTAMTAGAFNVLVLRQLWNGRVRIANDGDVHALDKTGMPIVFSTSALSLMVNADSTSTGVPELQIEIANG